ncbi:MAG: DUF86 domain-containing protein [Promethearchaeota archaeon]
MSDKLLTYLKDIKMAITSIEKFIEDLDFDQFKNDDKTSSAVIRKFEIIGEATKKIPESIRKQYSQIQWKDIAGMRDKLIHAYSEVDLKLIWTTIHKRLPKLKSTIEILLEKK